MKQKRKKEVVTKTKKKEKKQKLSTYILLDRSGSMSNKWAETMSALNSFADDLAKNKKTETLLTLAIFDAQSYDILRDEVNVSDWKKISPEEASPRGYTPLYDSVAKIISKAESKGEERTQIVIITDGEENCSREITKEGVKLLIEKCKDKKWDIVFLGADFDAMGQSAAIGLSQGVTLNTSHGNYGAAMGLLNTRSAMYADGGAAMDWSVSDRQKALGKVK